MSKSKRALAALGGGLVTVLLLITAASASGPDPAPATQSLTRTCTTDGSGYCTVIHTLGVVPDGVVTSPVIAAGATSYTLSVVDGSATASQVRVRAVRSNGNIHSNQAIKFSLVLFGGAVVPTTTTTAPLTTTTVPVTTTTVPVTTTTPAPAGGCALPAYPDATCTGVPVGTTLTVVNGDLNVTTPNTVIDGKDIRGCVNLHTTGVVIHNSKISCTGYYVIYAHVNESLLIEDSELDCLGTRGTAIGDTNITARRLNIHGCENGFDIDGNFVVEDSFVHALFSDNEAHSDGAQFTDIAHDITLRHNTIYSRTTDGLDGVSGTSSVITHSVSLGVARNVLLENNLFGGGAYSLYCPQGGQGVNYRVVGNHFTTRWHPLSGAYGPWTDCEDEALVTGNVYHESGLPLP